MGVVGGSNSIVPDGDYLAVIFRSNFRSLSDNLYGLPAGVTLPLRIESSTDSVVRELESMTVKALPMVSGMWESLPPV